MLQIKKTKLIVTVGPALQKDSNFDAINRRGADAYRISAFHNNINQITDYAAKIKEVNPKAPIILELIGNQPRIISYKRQSIFGGEELLLLPENSSSKEYDFIEVSNLDALINSLTTHSEIIINNSCKLKVTEIKNKTIKVKALSTSKIKKGDLISSKNISFSSSGVNQEDLKIIDALKVSNIDYFQVNYIKSIADFNSIKEVLPKSAKIISTIETKESLELFNQLSNESAALILNVNNLSSQVSAERMPIIQKSVLKAASEQLIPIFIESMYFEGEYQQEHIDSTSISSFILDGADGIVLDRATSTASDPVEQIEKVIATIEIADTIRANSANNTLPVNPIPNFQKSDLPSKSISTYENPLQAGANQSSELNSISTYISGIKNINAHILIGANKEEIKALALNGNIKSLFFLSSNLADLKDAMLVYGCKTIYIPSIPNDRDELLKLVAAKVYAVGSQEFNSVLLIARYTYSLWGHGIQLEINRLEDLLKD